MTADNDIMILQVNITLVRITHWSTHISTLSTLIPHDPVASSNTAFNKSQNHHHLIDDNMMMMMMMLTCMEVEMFSRSLRIWWRSFVPRMFRRVVCVSYWWNDDDDEMMKWWWWWRWWWWWWPEPKGEWMSDSLPHLQHSLSHLKLCSTVLSWWCWLWYQCWNCLLLWHL